MGWFYIVTWRHSFGLGGVRLDPQRNYSGPKSIDSTLRWGVCAVDGIGSI